jgi:hypothetical protein
MKKLLTSVVTAVLATSFIAGCGNKLTESDPSVSITSSVASSEQSGATSEQAKPKTFEDLYGNQLMPYMNHQYYYDGQPIMKQESNFYFINSFYDLTNLANMGYYPQTALNFVDLAAKYENNDKENNYETIGDYFVYYAEHSIQSTCILCDRAQKEGVKLPEETMKAIDDLVENIRKDCKEKLNMSLDDYLSVYYGPDINEAAFRKVVERYYLADLYSKQYCENYKFSDAEKNLPYIRYALFYAPGTADKATKDSALEAAKKMKDSCKSIGDLTGLAQSAQELGTVYDQGDIAVPKGQMAKKFEEWAYSKNRKEGELDVIYDSEWGYFVVGYLGLQNQISKVPKVRYALFSAAETESQATKDAALESAKKMKNSCKSIDDLTGLAESGKATGLVRDQGDILVTKGQFVPKFEEWSYGSNRKEGELDIIYAPEYGYFVVGFLGIQEQRSEVLNNIALKSLSDDILKEIESKKHSFHTDDKYAPAPAAPTATPAPEVTNMPEPSLDPNATTSADPNAPQQNGNSSTDVLIIVFFTLAGVAILAVIIILINNAVNNKNASGKSNNDFDKPAGKAAPSGKSLDDDKEDEEDEEEDEDTEDEEEDDEE